VTAPFGRAPYAGAGAPTPGNTLTLGPASAQTALPGPTIAGGLAPSAQALTLGPAPALATLAGPWALSDQALTLGSAPALATLAGPWALSDQALTLGPAPALAILAGPSSTGTAPWEVPGGPDLAAWVYDRAGGLVGTLTDSFARTWHEILSDVGDWRLTLANGDVVLAHAVYGQIVRFALNGTVRFAGLLESKAATTAAPGEEVDEVTVCSGRGTLAIWEEALVLPVLGIGRRAFSEYRMFNFASPDLDISAWTPVVTRVQDVVVVQQPETVPGDILFAFDSATLSAGADPVLAAILSAVTGRLVRIKVEGHTDSDGSEGYNQGLSERRAAAVRDWFVSHGVPSGLITVMGWGELRPVAPNDTPENKAKNRRVEITLNFADPVSHNTVPQRWPDPGALKIWMDWPIGDRPAPVGDVYAGGTFAVSPAAGVGTYRVFATADDGYEVWIDGDYVLGETTPLIWDETGTTEVILDAGTHTIRMKGTNLNLPDNVAWMMCSVMETTDGGATLGAVVARTDGGWVGVGYPAVPPGFSPGTILRLLLAEAQARGALVGVTLGCTDLADSAGVAWPITSDVAFQVGSDMLSALKQLCETYMDVAMDPASMRLDAWVARGTTTAVTLARSTDATVGNVTEMHHDGSA
jgi:outer membrane protein OmpA-like peptidoglycan-associated protein